MLRLANVCRSLWSLGTPFVTHFIRYSGCLALPLSLTSFATPVAWCSLQLLNAPFGRWMLPLVAFATCAHSLRLFALVAKAPYVHLATCAHTLRSFALVTPKGCSIGLYCELRVVFALRLIQLSLVRHSRFHTYRTAPPTFLRTTNLTN